MVTVSPFVTVSSLFPGSALKSYKTCPFKHSRHKANNFNIDEWHEGERSSRTQAGASLWARQPTQQHCQCCSRKSKDIKSRSDEFLQLYFADAITRQSGVALPVPASAQGRRYYSDPHLPNGTSPDPRGPRWHTHTKTNTHTHAWVSGDNVKTESKYNSWWLFEAAPSLAVLVLLNFVSLT